MLGECHILFAKDVSFRDDNLKVLNNNITQVKNRLDKIYDDKLVGLINESTYHRKREQFIKEREDIERQIKNHTIAEDKYIDFGCLILDVANRASEIYKVRNSGIYSILYFRTIFKG